MGLPTGPTCSPPPGSTPPIPRLSNKLPSRTLTASEVDPLCSLTRSTGHWTPLRERSGFNSGIKITYKYQFFFHRITIGFVYSSYKKILKKRFKSSTKKKKKH